MDRARTRRGWSVPADRSGVPARVTPHDISPRRTVTALRSHGRPKIDRGTICPARRPGHPFWTYAPARNFIPDTDPQAARQRSTVCPPTTHPGRPGPTPAHQGPRRPTRADPRPRRPTRAHVDPPAPHVGPLGPTSAHAERPHPRRARQAAANSRRVRTTPGRRTHAPPAGHRAQRGRHAERRTARAGGSVASGQATSRGGRAPGPAAPGPQWRRGHVAGGHPVQQRARVAVASRADTRSSGAPGPQWRRGHVARGHPVQQRPGRSGVAGTSRAGGVNSRRRLRNSRRPGRRSGTQQRRRGRPRRWRAA